LAQNKREVQEVGKGKVKKKKKGVMENKKK
jgi:hypothetical protein